jgi:hypothetical protein
VDALGAYFEPGAVLNGFRGGGAGADAGTDVTAVFAPSDITSHQVFVTGYAAGPGTFSGSDLMVDYAGKGGVDGFLFSSYLVKGLFAYFASVEMLGGEGDDYGLGAGTGVVASWPAPEEHPIVVTGAFRGTASIGSFSLSSKGGADAYVGRIVVDLTAVEDEPNGTVSLSESIPNPFRYAAMLTLTLMTPQAVRAEVLDLLGRRVALLHDGMLGAGAHTLVWEAGSAPAGLYLVRITTDAGTLTRKVVRAR